MKRVQQVGKALGSDVTITLLAKTEAELTPVFRAVWSTITSFEQRFSRFTESSELSQFNQQAGRKVTISREFSELLAAAKDMSQKTNGLYNPLTLPALQQAGYVGSWPAPEIVTKSLDFRTRLAVANPASISILGTTAQIPAGSALDFGGIGKGFLLDKLSRQLEQIPLINYWLSLGGDIVCSGHNLDVAPWKIGIAKAEQPDQLFDEVTNQTGSRLAVATSGVTKRRGSDWHHLIDPRTGLPAKTALLTATVCANTAVAADVFAKCIVIGGLETANNFAKKEHILKAILQPKTKAVTT